MTDLWFAVALAAFSPFFGLVVGLAVLSCADVLFFLCTRKWFKNIEKSTANAAICVFGVLPMLIAGFLVFFKAMGMFFKAL